MTGLLAALAIGLVFVSGTVSMLVVFKNVYLES
jgi:hypothetical protein